MSKENVKKYVLPEIKQIKKTFKQQYRLNNQLQKYKIVFENKSKGAKLLVKYLVRLSFLNRCAVLKISNTLMKQPHFIYNLRFTIYDLPQITIGITICMVTTICFISFLVPHAE